MYADKEFYRDDFMGYIVEDDEELNRLLKRASFVVDQVTNYKLKAMDFETLDPFFQEQIKLATCAQAEHFAKSGGVDAVGYDDLTSVQVGSFQYQTSDGGHFITQDVYSFLKPTGLLYQGVVTYGY